VIQGRVWRFGDHINTDIIIPGRYLDDYDPKHLAAHVMEDADPVFARSVHKGDIVVAGRNFGCGSSREQAPVALKAAGVAAVVAKSFSRIFYRNAINIGLPALVCPQAVDGLQAGEVASIDLLEGVVRIERDGAEFRFEPLPAFLAEILEKGGLVPYTKARLRSPDKE